MKSGAEMPSEEAPTFSVRLKMIGRSLPEGLAGGGCNLTPKTSHNASQARAFASTCGDGAT